LNVHGGHPRDSRDCGAGLLANLVAVRRGRRVQLNRERDAAAVDAEVLHELRRDDVFVKIGVLDRAERVENGSV
jgi:hypothetical protein